jgi:hypothetical protein
MRLIFKKLEIHSFMPFEDEVFEFDEMTGLTLVKGINHDIPDETNGAGKCLDSGTNITIEVSDPEIEKDLLSILNAES